MPAISRLDIASHLVSSCAIYYQVLIYLVAYAGSRVVVAMSLEAAERKKRRVRAVRNKKLLVYPRLVGKLRFRADDEALYTCERRRRLCDGAVLKVSR